MPDILI